MGTKTTNNTAGHWNPQEQDIAREMLIWISDNVREIDGGNFMVTLSPFAIETIEELIN